MPRPTPFPLRMLAAARTAMTTDPYVNRLINLRGGWYAASIAAPTAALAWAVGSTAKLAIVATAVLALTAITMPICARWFESREPRRDGATAPPRRPRLTSALTALAAAVLLVGWLAAVVSAFARMPHLQAP
jgi:hypothetical protein